MNRIVLLLYFAFVLGAAHAQTARPDGCFQLQELAVLNRISKSVHSLPLFIANDVIVCSKELKPNLLDSVSIIKCPQSLLIYGYPGANGVIAITTRQHFDALPLSGLAKEWLGDAGGPAVFCLNGWLVTDTAIKISKKAVRRIHVIKKLLLKFQANPNTICISIWTISKKEMRKERRRGLACRGVGTVASLSR